MLPAQGFRRAAGLIRIAAVTGLNWLKNARRFAVRGFPCCGEIRGAKLHTAHPSVIANLRTSIVAIVFAVLGAASTFGAAPLSSIAAIDQLTNDEAAKQIAVD